MFMFMVIVMTKEKKYAAQTVTILKEMNVEGNSNNKKSKEENVTSVIEETTSITCRSTNIIITTGDAVMW